jgi:hypothetical protein
VSSTRRWARGPPLLAVFSAGPNWSPADISLRFLQRTVSGVPVPGARPLPLALLRELRPLSLDDQTISPCGSPGGGPLCTMLLSSGKSMV